MPFLPLHDNTPRILIALPWVTWGVIAACTVIFFLQTQASADSVERMAYGLGVIPATLVGDAALVDELYMVPPLLTLITSLFLHGDFMHLFGNMLYLWVFGDNIEDSMGHVRFVCFYLLCGVLAALAHVVADPASTVPTIGASGAISGVLGAYLVLHPRAKVLVPIIIIPLYVPAFILLLIWIGFQVLQASMTGVAGGGVAWWAHIGGFVIGAILVIPFRYKAIPLLGAADPPGGLRIAPGFRRKPGAES